MQAISYKNENLNITEPFKGLFTQGMVCHETYKDKNNNWLSPYEVFSDDGVQFYQKKEPQEKVKVGASESMSKSKKNTIDPENIINKYGADAVRFFILADSPPEKDVQWSDNGMISAHKFVQKFWSLNEQILEITESNKFPKNEELEIFTNQIINKTNQALEKFRYNVIIANYHEIYSFYKKIIEKKQNFENFKNNYIKILLIMMPVLPHIINECIVKFNGVDQIKWPEVDKKYINNEVNEIVIQVNGKKRNTISVEKNIEEKEIIGKINELKLIEKHLKNGKIVKTIYVKNRLINYIIK